MKLEIKKVEFFLCNERKIALKPTIHQIQLSQKDYRKNFKTIDHEHRF